MTTKGEDVETIHYQIRTSISIYYYIIYIYNNLHTLLCGKPRSVMHYNLCIIILFVML